MEAEAGSNFRKMPASASPSAAQGNNMDAETPEVIRHLERVRYDSPEWYADAGIAQRGLGNRTVETDADVYQIDKLREPGK